jgi:hypothetical protein
MDGIRRRMSGWGKGAMGRFTAKDARRFEVLSEKRERVGRLRDWPRFDDDGPSTTPAAVMDERRPRRGLREDMAAAGRRKEPGPATGWFEACVHILVLGLFYQLIGTLMVRFLGFGGFLVTLGALMVVIGIVGIWLTPIVWIIGIVAKAVSKEERVAW